MIFGFDIASFFGTQFGTGIVVGAGAVLLIFFIRKSKQEGQVMHYLAVAQAAKTHYDSSGAGLAAIGILVAVLLWALNKRRGK